MEITSFRKERNQGWREDTKLGNERSYHLEPVLARECMRLNSDCPGCGRGPRVRKETLRDKGQESTCLLVLAKPHTFL